MAQKTDITGQKFDRLLVIMYTGNLNASKKRMVLCRCDCGVEKEMVASNLVSGMSKSCGCLKVEKFKNRVTTHGMAGKTMYYRWNGMIQRCYNPDHSEYKNYGSRGIKVCDRWRNSVLNYIADLGEPPFKGASVDRINNDGDYNPENCKWSTKKEQSVNRRPTRLLSYNGLEMCVSDWERHLGFGLGTLKNRFAQGLSVQQALSIPKRKKGVRLL